MNTECLTIVVGIATIANAGALVYDVWRRNKIRSVSFVQVPNGNPNGFEEFKTGVQGNAKSIVIKSEGTVEIVRVDNTTIESYGRYIKWRN